MHRIVSYKDNIFFGFFIIETQKLIVSIRIFICLSPACYA